jgi:hypothetical protein
MCKLCSKGHSIKSYLNSLSIEELIGVIVKEGYKIHYSYKNNPTLTRYHLEYEYNIVEHKLDDPYFYLPSYKRYSLIRSDTREKISIYVSHIEHYCDIWSVDDIFTGSSIIDGKLHLHIRDNPNSYVVIL